MSMQAAWAQGQDRFPHLRWRLDEEAFAVFRRFGAERILQAGDTLFEAGDPSFSLFLVIEGVIEIAKGEAPLVALSANHSFGEMGLLRDAPRSAAARAQTDARLVEVSRQGIHDMLRDEPVWAARLYRVLSECLAEYLHISTHGASRPGAEG